MANSYTCEVCGAKVATVHLTEITKDGVKTVHLCEHCAEQKGIPAVTKIDLSDVLAGFLSSPAAKELAQLSQVSCPVCGMSYLEFRASGRLGCATDYTVFSEGLLPLLERIHGASQHTGKAPRTVVKAPDPGKPLDALKAELKKAIADENYERAAELRDQIKEFSEREDGAE
jgi:protein arginine kinase activator